MDIAVIGTGNIGSTLALGLRKAGHRIVLGVKDPALPFKGKEMAEQEGFSFLKVRQAVAQSSIVIISVPAAAVVDLAAGLGDTAGKIIIDTMNGVGALPAGFSSTSEALLANCNCTDIVKCFNSTGFENLANPVYNGEGLDMFVAGDSIKGKAVAIQLSGELGFAHCYDFGGNRQFAALEQFAFAWINLAILQKQGRDIAFKLIRR